FVVLCQGNRLLLAGNDVGPYHGTQYGVAELRRRLGVRWFRPGYYGEVVPRKATLEVADVEVRQRPDFKMRNWWGPGTAENHQLEDRWKLRYQTNPGSAIVTLPGDSTVRGLVPPELVKKQPELLALNLDGMRNIHLPNLINPKAVAI